MSLLWNWGSRTLLRRCVPSSSSSAGVSNFSTLSSPLAPSTSSIIPSRTPTSLSSLHLYTPLRFKGGVKTNSGAKKRFRVRGSGSIKRWVLWMHNCLDGVSIQIYVHSSNQTRRKCKVVVQNDWYTFPCSLQFVFGFFFRLFDCISVQFLKIDSHLFLFFHIHCGILDLFFSNFDSCDL